MGPLLIWQTKVGWTGTLVLAWAYQVRKKEGDYLSDALATTGMLIAVGSIWYPELRATMVGAAMATAAAPVAAVAVSTYAIGGVIAFAAADPQDEGWYGAEALKDYYHDPLGVTTEIATEYVVEPIANWLVRRAVQFAPVALLAREEIFKNRWMTGPVLPF
jgi:hypothetical protein